MSAAGEALARRAPRRAKATRADALGLLGRNPATEVEA
jgi:hypothetical protein